ncbi:MAG: AtzH-like domain-containing protein [Pseudonocardia sp.]
MRGVATDVTTDTAGTVVLDRPDVVAEVRAVFDRYERALADADLATLTQLIWDDPRTVRFGVTDRQRGASEIAGWRARHGAVPPGRRLYETTVLAVDDRTAVVSTLFDYPGGVGSRPVEAGPGAAGPGAADPGAAGAAIPGAAIPGAAGRVEGRQTQTWVRFADGWRIVAAHVSEVPTG